MLFFWGGGLFFVYHISSLSILAIPIHFNVHDSKKLENKWLFVVNLINF